jgi:hypothetical protein
MPASLDSTATIHRSFLFWGGGFYARVSAVLCVACVVLYWLVRPPGPPNGGSFTGYTLGTLALGLVLWLGWFGLRRRRYGGGERLDEVLSAHVYLGLAVALVALLHCGFRVHWNVHSLALLLLLGVVGSGIFGAAAFWSIPPRMTGNRAGMTLGTMSAELATIALRCRALSLSFPDDIVSLVARTTSPCGEAGRLGDMLGGRRNRLRQLNLAAIAQVQDELLRGRDVTPAEVLPLLQSLTQHLTLVERLTSDQRYRRMLLLWRAIHVPMTVALVAALAVHVLVVFYDW